MSKSTDKKSSQLGMKVGSAVHLLRKNILFSFAKKLNLDTCYHCKSTIITTREFSIEHKIPWLDNDPKLFWDLENIGFSHLSCNVRASRRRKKVYSSKKEQYHTYYKTAYSKNKETLLRQKRERYKKMKLSGAMAAQ